jgi:hypothetical protein
MISATSICRSAAKGKFLPTGAGRRSERCYAEAVAQAWREDFGETHRAIKTVMRWPGVSERTVKNWFSGASGSRGEHLVSLVRHSTAVLEAFLVLAEREQAVGTRTLMEARDMLASALKSVEDLLN